MSTPWVIIANPHAGGGRSRRRAAEVAALLQARGRPVDLHYTQSPEEAPLVARQAIDAGVDRLILSGGDGTIHRMLPLLADSSTTLAVLPFGTSNDFARALHLPQRPAAVATMLLEGRPQALDLGRVGDRFFCTVSTCGLDADISQAMLDGRIPFAGTAGYLYAALTQLRAYQPAHARLSGDFGTWEGPVLAVAAGNTCSYGGGLKIAPNADPTDGLFDVCVVGDMPRRTALHLLPRLFYGGHLRHPAVQILRTAHLTIETDTPRVVHADGEYVDHTVVDLAIAPKALSLILPPRS